MEFFLRQIYPWLLDLSIYSSVLPFLVGLILVRKHKSLQFRLIFMYVILVVSSEAVGQLTLYLGTKNNIWLTHLFTVLEFLLITAIYFHSFKSPAIKKGILLAALIFVGVSLIDAFVLNGISQMNSIGKMVGNSFIILATIVYFYKVANDLSITYLDRDPVFLLSCALLITKAGTTMTFALFNDALAVSYDAARICLAVMLGLNVFFNTAQMLILKRASA